MSSSLVFWNCKEVEDSDDVTDNSYFSKDITAEHVDIGRRIAALLLGSTAFL